MPNTQTLNQRGAIAIDFLFLDRETCTRCKGTEAALDEAIALTRPALGALGQAAAVRKVHVQSRDQAEAEDFVVSPTIRVNGADIHPEILLNSCAECGDLCGCEDGVDCRVWRHRGEEFTEPPVALLVEAIMTAAVGAGAREGAGSQPASLPDYFGAQQDADACCDKTTCCGGQHAA
jgi:hypothetical protein